MRVQRKQDRAKSNASVTHAGQSQVGEGYNAPKIEPWGTGSNMGATHAGQNQIKQGATHAGQNQIEQGATHAGQNQIEQGATCIGENYQELGRTRVQCSQYKGRSGATRIGQS
jgi:hypothetical protein